MARANSKPVDNNPTLKYEMFGFDEQNNDVNIPLSSIYNLIKISTTGISHNYICDSSVLEQGKFVPDSLVFNEITSFKLNNLDSYGSDMLSFFSLLSSKKDDLFLKINILGKSDFAVYKILSIDYSDNDFIIAVSLYKNISVGELTLKDNCYFDFLLERESDFSDTQLDRLKDSVYENISQTISVSPPSFEKGVPTNLTFTWRVTKNDDTLNTVTVDGVDKISEATGINRTYTVNNQVASRSVALVTNLTRNTVTGSTFTLTNSATSNAYVPQFKGQLADSLAADSYVLADLSTLTKLIQPGVGMSLAKDFTNKYGVIITKTEINKIVFSVAPEPLSIGNWDDGTSYFYKKSITLTLANGGTETMFLYRTRQLLNATTTFIIS
jgi:hypothetical protein